MPRVGQSLLRRTNLYAPFRGRSRALLAVSAALIGSAAYASSASAATYFVDPAGNDANACVAPGALACKTVNGGISKSLTPGDTIQVGTGTYTEQVVIDRNVVLKGSGLSSTVIASPATLATQFTRNGADIKPIVYVAPTGTGSTVRDLTIDGHGLGDSINRFWGLAFRDTSAGSHHIRVIRMRSTPFNGVQNGLGVLAYSDDAAPHTVSIDDTTITDFQKGG